MRRCDDMRKTILVVLLVLLGLAARPLPAISPTLGAAGSYSVLAGSTVTNTGPSTVQGDLGVSPGSAVTGFPPGQVGPPGTIHAADANAAAAQADNVAAFTFLDQGCDTTYAGVQDLTLVSPLGPGVYCADAFLLTGNLTLSGSGVWIFKSTATLTTSSNSSVTGGDPCNVWWRLVSSGTLGTGTQFIGNILALASITVQTGANLNGRALAQTGQVSLDTNNIAGPFCAAAATDTPVATLTETPTSLPGATPTSTPLQAFTDTPLPGPTDTPIPLPSDTPRPVDTQQPPPADTPIQTSAPVDTPTFAPPWDTPPSPTATATEGVLPVTGYDASIYESDLNVLDYAPVESGPDAISIPAIGLLADVLPAPIGTRNMAGVFYGNWDVPDEFAAGWLPTSAIPGDGGNIVLGGHHNVYGEVFGRLIELKAGDTIRVYVGKRVYIYRVSLTMLLAERDQPIEVRLSNSQWIAPSADERLTLVTCWPAWSNTHRLIVVALPVKP